MYIHHSKEKRCIFKKKVCEGVKTAQAVHSDEDNRSEQKLREEEIAGQNKNIRSSIPSHGVPLVEKECLKKNLTRVAKNGAVKRKLCAQERKWTKRNIENAEEFCEGFTIALVTSPSAIWVGVIE